MELLGTRISSGRAQPPTGEQCCKGDWPRIDTETKEPHRGGGREKPPRREQNSADAISTTHQDKAPRTTRWGGASGTTGTGGASTRTSRTPKTRNASGTGVRQQGGANPKSLRQILRGSYRKAGVTAPNGETGEGGVFSDGGDVYGEKSQFNKEKWLPLVYTPIPISHYCCFKIKKLPLHRYQTENHFYPIIATLAEESRVRKQGWIRHGCNAFDSNNPMSQPMSFWTEQDVLAYIALLDLPIASVYGEVVSVDSDGNQYEPLGLDGKPRCNLKCTGCQRTGCAFCAFGLHMERKGKTRFQILAEIEPKKYDYAMRGGQWVDNPSYDPSAPKYDGDWLNWNPEKIWVPSKDGLGLKKVFEMVNEIYGKDFYRYE